MIHLRPTVQALESQIVYLKERLEKAEREKREVEELGRQRVAAVLDRLAEVEKAARAREDALLERIAKLAGDACQRSDALLDRLLAKNNIAPVVEPPKPAAAPEVATPYGGMGPEYQEAYKDSFIAEETAWLMNNDPMLDEGTARILAEQEYLNRYQPIR